MSKAPTYNQGGDAQAIKRVANSYYGSYKNMFEEHGWPERGEKMMLAGQSRVVEDYGSVLKFEEAHRSDGIMFPMEAIYSDPPNVWLTSFYGFNPEKWGMLGFTLPEARDSFLNRSQSGALVVVYGSGEAAKDELGKVIGIQQCSHVTGNAENFIAPPEWIAKSRDLKKKEQWNFAVRAEKAWRVTPSSRMNVRDFAPKATETGAWQHIGAYGVPLTKSEALNILKLGLQEVEVYGRDHIFSSASGTAREILAPSKAGPVSQNPYVVKEAEGPKHLYILSLQGDADAFWANLPTAKRSSRLVFRETHKCAVLITIVRCPTFVLFIGRSFILAHFREFLLTHHLITQRREREQCKLCFAPSRRAGLSVENSSSLKLI